VQLASGSFDLSRRTFVPGGMTVPTAMISSETQSADAAQLADNDRAVSIDRRRLSRLIQARKPDIAGRWFDCQFADDRIRRYAIAGLADVEKRTLLDLYVGPLFDLLVAYLRTGEDRYRDVYLDERLRYAPHSSDRATRTSYFAEVIPSDEEAVIDVARGDSELASDLRVFLTDLHTPLLAPPLESSVRLLALGDCLMNELRVFLPGRCRAVGISLDTRMLYFSAAMGKDLPTREALAFLSSNPADLIGLSFLSYEGLPLYPLLLRDAPRLSSSEVGGRVAGIVGLMRRFMSAVRERTDVPFLLHNASGLPLTGVRRRLPLLPPLSAPRRGVLDAMNDAIRELAEHLPNTLVIDEAGVAAARGYRTCAEQAIPQRLTRRALFHVSRFGQYLADPYLDVITSHRDLKRAKVLLVDFDNTLWNGVMADGQVEQFQDRQRLLKRLKEGGILLVAVSKNDPANVRWNEMALDPSDFALLKINWNPKVDSVREAAAQLDLGLDSFVFVDDSGTERGLVSGELPQVRTLDATLPESWRSLERLLAFPNTGDTAEARARTELYRAQAMRKEALSQTTDYPALMATLRLEARFGAARASDLNRITELVQRTNQFNTTTIRYSRSQLQEFLSSESHCIYVAELSDRYSSFGLVAVVIVERRDGAVIFDSFVMSCRAMGFGFERLVLSLVMQEENDAKQFIGRYAPTDRNLPAADLFAGAGFNEVTPIESELDATAPRDAAPPWFTVIAR
jgi:FkbH-like protein